VRVPDSRVYRRQWRWLVVSLTGVMALVALSGTTASDTGAPPSTLQRTACALVTMMLVLTMVRTSLLAVVLSDHLLTVRNLFRTYSIPWDQVASVQEPPAYGAWRNAGVRIFLQDGRIISATAFTRGRVDATDVGTDVVSAIRERVGRRRP
jgi:hypothetical protein